MAPLLLVLIIQSHRFRGGAASPSMTTGQILATLTPIQLHAGQHTQQLGRAPTASHQEPSWFERSVEASIPVDTTLFHGRSPVEVHQDRKRKACCLPFPPLPKHKTPQKTRASPRYQWQQVQTTNARNIRDIHFKSNETAEEGLEMLRSEEKLAKKKVANLEDEEEKAKRALRIMTDKKALLHDDRRIIADEISEQDVLKEELTNMSHEADHHKLYEEQRKSELLEYLYLRSTSCHHKSNILHDCSKKELRNVFEVPSSSKLAYFTTTGMETIFDHLRVGGYRPTLQDEWVDRVKKWSAETWEKETGERGDIAKRRWLKNKFVDIFGLTITTDSSGDWLNENASGPHIP